MDIKKAISELITLPGVTGAEEAVCAKVQSYFSEYTNDVWSDNLGNAFCRIGNPDGPTLLVAAHMDEIGMMVTAIEPNGMLKICSVAGVDPRVLPGSRVIVHGKEPVMAIVGAIPPHLQNAGDNSAAYKIDDLVCDTGFTPEKVNELIRVGDFVTFELAEPMELKNNILAGKTFDDRACVCIMFEAMDILKKYALDCNVVFCATVQEERGSFGALTAGYGIKPDMAIAIDVTHAPQPGGGGRGMVDFDKVAICRGGNIHPKVFERMESAAAARGIAYEVEVMMGHTGTDAWELQNVRGGIPTGLISLPLRYMHTSVEVISIDTLKNCAKLLAEIAMGIGADLEETLCLDD